MNSWNRLQQVSHKKIYYTIFFLALSIRILFVFTDGNDRLHGDEVGYDFIANQILAGNGFLSDIGGASNEDGTPGYTRSYKVPLYPLFLAAIYFVYKSIVFVKIIQAVLGALVCVYVYKICCLLFKEKAVPFIAGMLSMVYPSLTHISSFLLSEGLFTWLFVLHAYFLIKFIQKKTRRDLIFSIFLLALSVLARPTSLYVIIFLVGYFLIEFKFSRKFLTYSITAIIVFIATILPWTIRNYMVHDSFVFLATSTGYGLYASNHPPEGKLFGFGPPDDEVLLKSNEIKNEIERSKYLLGEAKKFVYENPLEVLRLTMLKALFFLCIFDWEIFGQGEAVLNWGFVTIIPFLFFFLFKKEKEDIHKSLYLLILTGYVFLIAIMSIGLPRYRMPVEPFLIVVAAKSIVDFISLERFSKKIVPIMVCLLFFSTNVLISFNSLVLKNLTKDLLITVGIWY